MGCFLLWLLYLNRSSTRIHEATAVVAVVIIGALAFVMKGESFQKTIHSAYFINLKERSPLFFDMPVLMYHYLSQEMIFQRYKKRLSDQKKEFPICNSEYGKTLVHLQAIAILDLLHMFYNHHWYTEIVSIETPGGGKMKTFPVMEKEKVEKDLFRYSKDSLPNSLKQNIFFDDFDPLGTIVLTLPKHTKFYYSASEGNNLFCEYRFVKPLIRGLPRFYIFDIKVKISPKRYTRGLGIVGNYIGVPSPYYEDMDIKDIDASQGYGNFLLRIDCEAKFTSFLAWYPPVVRYKKWVKTLFDELYNNFDWSACKSRIRDYQLDLASRIIIDKSK